MSNQRPPGGIEGPTQDPERPRQSQGGEPPRREPPAEPPGAEPWADSDRTQAYTPRRRSIVDRLGTPEQDPEPTHKTAATEPPPTPKPHQPPQAYPQGQQARRAAGVPPGAARGPGRHALAGRRREGKGLRFAGVLAGVVVLGLIAGGAAAWVSGWRPGFLGSPGDSPPAADKPAGAAPQAKPGDPKPGDPPKAPPGGEVTRACFTGTTDIKTGSGACGFALDGAGTVTFKGEPIAERLAAGSGPAQRLVLYPFAPSGRYVFLRACDSASGGRCAVQRLADTKEKKLFEVKGGAEGFAWVAWSPKEQVGLLGYREGGTDAIAAIATSDGRTLKTAPLGTGKNRYAVVKQASMRWRNEESFTVEVKLCPFAKGRTRNTECEDDDDVRFRRRTVKVTP